MTRAEVATTGIDIYLHSAGYGMRHDFRWKDAHSRPTSAAVSGELDRLLALAYSQTTTSLCVERRGSRLWLIACNLPSTRRDFLGRPIANSLVLRAPATADAEHRLRTVAARVLEDPESVAAELDNAIQAADDKPGGWEADPDALETIVAHGGTVGAELASALPNQSPQAPRWEERTPESVAALVGELSQFRLPDRQGILVLVSPHHDIAALEGLDVWRGLSVDAPPPDEMAASSDDEAADEDEPISCVAAGAPAPGASTACGCEPARKSDAADRGPISDVLLVSGIVVLFGLVVVMATRRRG